MKEEGEVWQLATVEVVVCWKCGLSGHIGDRCFQDVSALAASLVGTDVSQQPSWAHVVRGACGVPLPQLSLIPPAPPLPLPTLAGKMSASVTAGALLLARSHLNKYEEQADKQTVSWWVEAYKTAKAGVGHLRVSSNGNVEVCEVLSKDHVLENDMYVDGSDEDPAGVREVYDEEIIEKIEVEVPSRKEDQLVIENNTEKDEVSNEEKENEKGGVIQSHKGEDQLAKQSISHSDQVQLDHIGGGLGGARELLGDLASTQSEAVSSVFTENVSLEVQPNSELVDTVENISGAKLSRSDSGSAVPSQLSDVPSPTRSRKVAGSSSNTSRPAWKLWFDIAMEDGTELGGGRIEFGFSENNFSNIVEDYFWLFEDECNLMHHCGGRVKGVRLDMMGALIPPPSWDDRNIPELLAKVGDGCVSDSGWREVDIEEWE